MRKRVLGAALAIGALVLAGCGSGGSDSESSGPVEITFSHWALTAPPFGSFTKSWTTSTHPRTSTSSSL